MSMENTMAYEDDKAVTLFMECYGIAKYYYLLLIGLYIGSIFY